MRQHHTVFLINLLQDVNIIRPLVLLAAEAIDTKIVLLVSYKFLQRDKANRQWQKEVARLAGNAGADVIIYSSVYEALKPLQGQFGVMIAASESDLSGHAETHDVFRAGPVGFLKITLQHGFECVGFMQNREHDRAHGTHITFAADVVCGWFEAGRMRSLAPTERSKLYVTGPTVLLQEKPQQSDVPANGGIVCENLHSVRLRASGDFTNDFMKTFTDFCALQESVGKSVHLRPHPGGQYVVKNKIALPLNVSLANDPIYETDLSAFDYGISAPSSILIDMVLAGLPVAVWSDTGSVMDVSNYRGLCQISDLEDWSVFAERSVNARAEILSRQNAFLKDWGLNRPAQEVRSRFTSLMAQGSQSSILCVGPTSAPDTLRRILIVANGNIPTVQLCLMLPLAELVDTGHVEIELFTERDIAQCDDATINKIVNHRFKALRPDVIVFCRYSGAGYQEMITAAQSLQCPTIYHVDDDLLNIPIEIGEDKYLWHNRLERLSSVRFLQDNVDLIYTSTDALKSQIVSQGACRPVHSGRINCSGRILKRPSLRSVQKIGYMGFGHENDLKLILPSIVRLLETHETITFELFGTIPKPQELNAFGDRVKTIPPEKNYTSFMQKLADLDWDVGICPLLDVPFNHLKSNNKWVEYSSVGCATVATRGSIYDDCCSGGAGLLVDGVDEWFNALDKLVRLPSFRIEIATKAQTKLENEYSESLLRAQILDVFAIAKKARSTRSGPAIEATLNTLPETAEISGKQA